MASFMSLGLATASVMGAISPEQYVMNTMQSMRDGTWECSNTECDHMTEHPESFKPLPPDMALKSKFGERNILQHMEMIRKKMGFSDTNELILSLMLRLVEMFQAEVKRSGGDPSRMRRPDEIPDFILFCSIVKTLMALCPEPGAPTSSHIN